MQAQVFKALKKAHPKMSFFIETMEPLQAAI